MLPRGQEVLPRGQEVLPRGQEVLPRGQEVLPRGQTSSCLLQPMNPSAGYRRDETPQTDDQAATEPLVYLIKRTRVRPAAETTRPEPHVGETNQKQTRADAFLSVYKHTRLHIKLFATCTQFTFHNIVPVIIPLKTSR